MLLESSYDLAFIDEELAALQDYFEIFGDIITENYVNERAHEVCANICKHHQLLVIYDMDCLIEMLRGHFLPQLKTIIPARFDLGVMLWTKSARPDGLLPSLYFQMVAQPEINAFVAHTVTNPDSRVSMFGERGQKYWLVIIRMEKANIYDIKLLK